VPLENTKWSSAVAWIAPPAIVAFDSNVIDANWLAFSVAPALLTVP
jgi:hypothetical protein